MIVRVVRWVVRWVVRRVVRWVPTTYRRGAVGGKSEAGEGGVGHALAAYWDFFADG